MNNPVLSARLSEGLMIRGAHGEAIREAAPLKDLARNFSMAEYKQIKSSEAEVGLQTGTKGLFGDNSQLSVQIHGGDIEGA